MLVVPNHWHGAPLTPATAFAARLRSWSDDGVEMFVHGWFHRDECRHGGWRDRLRASTMTAGEGEFLGLSEAEARRRMLDGKALIEDIIGRAVAGFIAPAWLYGPGAMRALAGSGFALAEDHMKVWEPGTGRIVSRGPVLTWATRSPWRALSSRLAAAAGRRLLGGLETVRVAVHPGDLSRADIVESIERTFSALLERRTRGRYADLLGAAA